MKIKKESTVLSRILKKAGPSIGATVVLEPEWGIVGQITFKNGRKTYFRYNTLDLNLQASAEVAKDKDYSYFFMKKMGYSIVPKTRTFFSKDWGETIRVTDRGVDAAFEYAHELGFPVIIKPNSGSQGGDISLVYNKEEFYKVARAVFKKDRVLIVQSYVSGRDYRIVVLDDQIISAYERIPLNVVGDGVSSIKELLDKKQNLFLKDGRDIKIKFNDPRIIIKLKHQKCTLDTVLPRGQKIFLLDNANLSTGGDAVDVTDKIHSSFKKMAIQLTRDMGLRLCGVDVIVNGEINEAPKKYWILEVNASPGLDHYLKMGKAQAKIVEDLYLKILKHLAK